MGRREKGKELIPVKRCTAISKQSGHRCKQNCVVGHDVCHYHGAKGGRPMVHGIYSGKLKKSVEKHYEEFLSEQDTVTNLQSDIALMKALMVDTLDNANEDGDLSDYDIQNIIMRYMKDIRSTTALKNDIENRYSVSIENVKIFLNQVLFVLDKHLGDDPAVLNAVIGDVRKVKLIDGR